MATVIESDDSGTIKLDGVDGTKVCVLIPTASRLTDVDMIRALNSLQHPYHRLQV